MIRFALIQLISLLTFSSLMGQQWTNSEIEIANTAKNATYMTQEERDVIKYINLARLNGEKFFNTFFKDYSIRYRIDTTEVVYYKSLETELLELSALYPLQVCEQLTKCAKEGALWQKNNNEIGHEGVWERFDKYGIETSKSGENCSYGVSSAIDVVCQLLHDDGVRSLGHRKNILSVEYTAVGVGGETHPSYKYVFVLDFANNLEKLSLPQEYASQAKKASSKIIHETNGNEGVLIDNRKPMTFDTEEGGVSHRYKTVKINGSWWFAQNISFEKTFVSGYNDDKKNAETYGLMYRYSETFDVCPDGWHIPTKAEWEGVLNSNQKNLLNFTKCGERSCHSVYSNIGSSGKYWTSTKIEGGDKSSYYWTVKYNSNETTTFERTWEHDALYVRCKQD